MNKLLKREDWITDYIVISFISYFSLDPLYGKSSDFMDINDIMDIKGNNLCPFSYFSYISVMFKRFHLYTQLGNLYIL